MMFWWSMGTLHFHRQRMGPAGTIDRASASQLWLKAPHPNPLPEGEGTDCR